MKLLPEKRHALLSDGVTSIKTKFSVECLSHFETLKGYSFFRKEHIGGIVQVYDLELRATQLAPVESQIQVYIKCFQLVGSTGSQTFGRPVEVYGRAQVKSLLRKIFRAKKPQPDAKSPQEESETYGCGLNSVNRRSSDPLNSLKTDLSFASQALFRTHMSPVAVKKPRDQVEINGAVNLSRPQLAGHTDDRSPVDGRVIAQYQVSDAGKTGLQTLFGQMRDRNPPKKAVQPSPSDNPSRTSPPQMTEPETIVLLNEEEPLRKCSPIRDSEAPTELQEMLGPVVVPESRGDLFHDTFEVCGRHLLKPVDSELPQGLAINSSGIPSDQESVLFGRGNTDCKHLRNVLAEDPLKLGIDSWHHPDAGFRFPAGPNIPPRLLNQLLTLARKRHAQGLDFAFPSQWSERFKATTELENIEPCPRPEATTGETNHGQTFSCSSGSDEESDEPKMDGSDELFPWSQSPPREDRTEDRLPPNSSWPDAQGSSPNGQPANQAEAAGDKGSDLVAGTGNTVDTNNKNTFESFVQDQALVSSSKGSRNLGCELAAPGGVNEEAESSDLELCAPRALGEDPDRDFQVGETPYRSVELRIKRPKSTTTEMSSSPPLKSPTLCPDSSQTRALPATFEDSAPQPGKASGTSSKDSELQPTGQSTLDNYVLTSERIRDVVQPALSQGSRDITEPEAFSDVVPTHVNGHLLDQAQQRRTQQSPAMSTPNRAKRGHSWGNSPVMPLSTVKRPRLDNDPGLSTPIEVVENPVTRARNERRRHFQKSRAHPSAESQRASTSLPRSDDPNPVLQHQNDYQTQHEATNLFWSSQPSPTGTNSAPSSTMPGSDVSALEDVYKLFTHTYSDYAGDLKHFLGLCRQLEQLQKAGREPKASLWDDFVIKHKLEYIAYTSRCIEEGDDPITYARYFREHNKKRKHAACIVNPQTINFNNPAVIPRPAPRSIPPTQPKAFAHEQAVRRRFSQQLRSSPNGPTAPRPSHKPRYLGGSTDSYRPSHDRSRKASRGDELARLSTPRQSLNSFSNPKGKF